MQSRSSQHLILFTLSVLFTFSALAGTITGSQNVYDHRFTPQYGNANLKDNAGFPGPFEWNITYTLSFDGTNLVNHVGIGFVFDYSLGFTDAQTGAFRAAAETNIEGIWNNKFSIVDPANGATYPLMVDLTTVGPFNKIVFISKGPGRDDVSNWSEDSTASIMAHEFGHMLGLFDEYIGGAVDRYPNPTLSDDGLMGLGALNAQPKMYPRYYQQDLDYMRTLNPDHSFTLQTVPEASTLRLLLAGAVALAAFRKKLCHTATSPCGRGVA